MKKYHFTLDPLLQVRKRKEDAVKLELGKKNREILVAQQQMTDLHDNLAAMQASEKERRTKGDVDVAAMRHSVNYRNKVKLDMISKGAEIKELHEHASTIQLRLTECAKERRAIEIIGEHRHDEWKKQRGRSERTFVDEVSTQGFIRKKRDAGT